MTRLFGALLILLFGGTLGLSLNRRARGQIERLDALIALFRLAKTRIDCFLVPLSEILSGCDRELLLRCGWREEDPPADFHCFCSELDRRLLTEEGRRILDECREGGLKGYKEEAVAFFDYQIGLLLSERDRLLSELPRKREENLALSLSGAALLVVVFW